MLRSPHHLAEETETPRKEVEKDPVDRSPILDEMHLVTRATGLGDDVGHLLNLPLGTAEGTELRCVSGCPGRHTMVGGWSRVRVDVPSSLLDDGRACPWSCAEVR
jgi:hypothetical protein